MITKEELRVGNAIQYDGDGTNAIVKSIEEYGIGIEFKEEETWIEYGQFSGVQITHDILVKIGLEQCQQSHLNFYHEDLIGAICFYGDGKYYYKPTPNWAYGDLKFRYVHQVQNFFYALTGKELIFEL